MVIAIDGLSKNGKTTLAKKISEKINFKNFSAGIIYRCIALYIIENKLDVTNITVLIENLKNININFDENKVYMDGKEVTNKIRTDQITFYATEWGAIPKLKEFVRNVQKEFIKNNNTVMEGRDIGTRIVPDADIKFYIYSDFETRVNRSWLQNKDKNINEIREKLKEIDRMDIEYKLFVKPEDAIEIDTTHYTLEDVYEIMMDEINKVIN